VQSSYLILLTVVPDRRLRLTDDSATRLTAVPVAFTQIKEGEHEKCNRSCVRVIDPWRHHGVSQQHGGNSSRAVRADLVPITLKYQ